MAYLNAQSGNLDQIFAGTLKHLYYAEKRIAETLPKLIDKSSATPLKEGLDHHLRDTRGHVRRIEDVFSHLGQQPEAAPCKAIDGILEAGEASLGATHGPGTRDAALAAAAQVVEHYEIARYGTLVAWAEQMQRPDLAEPLRATLAEEKAADRRLSEISEAALNPAA